MSNSESHPLVSILVPVYNAAAYLEGLRTCVLAQTYLNWELILVDDCSPQDDSALRLEALEKEMGPRVRCFYNSQNMGPSATLNRAARVANGSLLARLDADDVMHPERLARQVVFMQANPSVGLLGTAYRNIDDRGKTINKVRASVKGGAALRAAFLFYNPMGHSTVMYRKEVFEQAGGYNENLRASLDYDLLARLSLITECAVLPKVLVDYRTHTDNITTRTGNLQLANAKQVQRTLLAHYGFSANKNQLEVHYLTGLLRDPEIHPVDVTALRAVRKWLHELDTQNERNGAFPAADFERVLSVVHTMMFARKSSRLRLRDYLLTFTPDFSSLAPRQALLQLAHTLKNGF